MLIILAGYDEDVLANLVTDCSRSSCVRIEDHDGFDGVTVAAPGSVPDLNAGRRLPPSVAPLRVDNAADGGHYALV